MALKKWKESILGIIFIVLAIILYTGASKLPPSLLGGMGPDFMPKVIAIGMGIMGVLQLIVGIREVRVEPSEETGTDDEDKPEYWRVGLTILAFGVYVFSMNTIGFLICSVIYLFLQIMILAPKEKRKPLQFAIISLVFTVGVYYIFRNGLHVMLPRGILG